MDLFYDGRESGPTRRSTASSIFSQTATRSISELRHIQSETLWDAAGRAGRRSIVINVPSTYPARPLNGVLVSGFVAVDLNKATYPPELGPEPREMDYRIDVDARKVQESHDALMDEILKTLDRRVRTLLHLYDNGQWDLFIGVITETDRLQHFLWMRSRSPGTSTTRPSGISIGSVDNFLGEIAGRSRDETFDHERSWLHRHQTAGLSE